MATLRDFRFFRDHAGYIVGERALCAKRLADAERAAEDGGYTFEWSYDYDGDLGDHEYWCADASRFAAGRDYDGSERPSYWRRETCDHDVLACSMFDADGQTVGSLGGIIDPSDEYRRVIEAELASEHVRRDTRAPALA